MSAWAIREGEQNLPEFVNIELFVVLFGLTSLEFCMGEAFMVTHKIVAVASRRVCEWILIFLQLQSVF